MYFSSSIFLLLNLAEPEKKNIIVPTDIFWDFLEDLIRKIPTKFCFPWSLPLNLIAFWKNTKVTANHFHQ